MTTTKRQRKMSYRSSVTVNFVCATKFCFGPPFFSGSSPRALSAQYSAYHTSCKSQLAGFPAHPFLRPGKTEHKALGGARKALDRASKYERGELDLFRLQDIESSDVKWRSFLLLSWARVPTDSLNKSNLKYFRRFVDSHPGFSQWFDTFMSSFETEHFVNSQSISLTKSFK